MSNEEFTDEELEEIRRRRMMELQRSSVEEQKRAKVQQQVEAQKQSVLRQILAPEARQRLTNIKMVRPEFAEQLELQLMQLAQSGRVSLPISDQQLKEALARMQSQRREIRIRRQ
jgi:programmed cell death protein 5